MCYGGIEIANQCLTSNLQSNGHGIDGISCINCDPCCGDLNRALGYGENGGNIVQAPWYDPDEPASVEFAGLLVTSVEGLHPGEFTRSVTENAGAGAILGRGRQSAPVITVTGILMGSCCGAQYGLQWLRNVLKGPCGSESNCNGAEFEFLACPPVFRDEDCADNPNCLADCIAGCNGNEGCEAECEERCSPVDFEADLEPYLRNFRNVGLTSGPTISNRIPHGCPTCHDCEMLEVTFTLAAADPCVYRQPFTLQSNLVFDCNLPENDECIEWVEPGSIDCDPCGTADNCAVDPDCVDITPPSMPELISTCFTGCNQNDQCRLCFDIPEGVFPVNGEGTLIFEINSGSSALRNVRILGWTNSLGTDIADLAECDACFGINVSYVAPNSTLVVDGATRTATINCPGGSSVRANPFISSSSNSPAFTYPALDGCAAYTVCVYAEAPAAINASVSVTGIGREC
jgi:hypothetical protein